MKFMKFSLILFFVLIFSIGSVCAADLNSTDADVQASEDLSTKVEVVSASAEPVLKSSDTGTILTSDERAATVLLYSDMTTTAIDTKTDGKKGQYFKVSLMNSKGQYLANKTIEIGFNGAKHIIKTDQNGLAKLQINLVKATTTPITFAIFFQGDDDNKASFGVATLKVNKQTPKLTTSNKKYKASAKTKKLTATFKTSKGNPIVGKKVTFKVNGKSYTVKTNKKGVATIKVNIKKKKTYSFSVKFAGDNTYKSVTKNGKLVIK